mmetsp:Transcript_44502/g.93086  ORF Transcript_44502/g.93086 Transcript_44502/m.93086 type:complete len:382 (-) Transcript_44502:205-1350(-)
MRITVRQDRPRSDARGHLHHEPARGDGVPLRDLVAPRRRRAPLRLPHPQCRGVHRGPRGAVGGHGGGIKARQPHQGQGHQGHAQARGAARRGLGRGPRRVRRRRPLLPHPQRARQGGGGAGGGGGGRGGAGSGRLVLRHVHERHHRRPQGGDPDAPQHPGVGRGLVQGLAPGRLHLHPPRRQIHLVPADGAHVRGLHAALHHHSRRGDRVLPGGREEAGVGGHAPAQAHPHGRGAARLQPHLRQGHAGHREEGPRRKAALRRGLRQPVVVQAGAGDAQPRLGLDPLQYRPPGRRRQNAHHGVGRCAPLRRPPQVPPGGVRVRGLPGLRHDGERRRRRRPGQGEGAAAQERAAGGGARGAVGRRARGGRRAGRVGLCGGDQD